MTIAFVVIAGQLIGNSFDDATKAWRLGQRGNVK
jgi:hypothetical protein